MPITSTYRYGKLVCKDNHLYYECPENREYLFSSTELSQIHSHLDHAPPGSIYSALLRAYHIETYEADLTKLQEISAQCKGCQLYAKKLNQYRAVLLGQCIINYYVVICVMCIKQQPIIHAVCLQTHFTRASPLFKKN